MLQLDMFLKSLPGHISKQAIHTQTPEDFVKVLQRVNARQQRDLAIQRARNAELLENNHTTTHKMK